jgi:hypothetical protein
MLLLSLGILKVIGVDGALIERRRQSGHQQLADAASSQLVSRQRAATRCLGLKAAYR